MKTAFVAGATLLAVAIGVAFCWWAYSVLSSTALAAGFLHALVAGAAA